MYVSDSLVVIGLDYYLGENSVYRPQGYPEYILERYQKDYIVPAIILLLSDKYLVEDTSDRTMLADMVYYGKKYFFTKSILPCTPDSFVVWYSPEQLVDVNANSDIIWANFIENELLFETNNFLKMKFMEERPVTVEIGPKCPGRIGAWVGWEIVQHYANRTGNSVADIMSEPSAQKIFQESKYKGRSR